jgi:hypothetical protein
MNRRYNQQKSMKTNKNNSYWRLEGDYFDGCNCKSICPCIFALDPTEGDCKRLAAWHIEKGRFTIRYNASTASVIMMIIK